MLAQSNVLFMTRATGTNHQKLSQLKDSLSSSGNEIFISMCYLEQDTRTLEVQTRAIPHLRRRERRNLVYWREI